MNAQQRLINRIAKKTRTLSLIACALWAGASAYAAPSNYVSFDAPNSYGTQPQCINAAGTVVGYDSGMDGFPHGFLRFATGALTQIDAPDAVYGTLALGINASGATVGIYNDANGFQQGFVRSAGGAYVDVQVAGAFRTFATSINDSGAVLGSFEDTSFVYHGFIRAANGKITTFDAPGAGTGTNQGTITTYVFNTFGSGCSGLNDSGAATGEYADSNGSVHGFVRSATGTFATFDVPNATLGTIPSVISPTGTVAGSYYDQRGIHSFVRSATGVITPFDPSSGSTSSSNSVAVGINPAGTVVGSAQPSASYAAVGYVKSAQGTVTFLQFPGSPETYGSGINAAGTVAGFYFDQNGAQHGFVATSPY